MRILYHHRTQADGAEGVHIAEMVRAFRDLGHDVQVMGAEATSGVAAPGAAGRIKASLPAAAFELVACAYNVVEYLAVRRAISAFRPEVVYARHARFGFGAASATRRAGIPLALEVNCLFADERYHQFEPLAFRYVARTMERHALNAATVALPVSSPLAERIRAIATPRVVVLPNGADPVRFNAASADGPGIRARLGLVGACVAGWVGILRPWHGLELMLDAVAHVEGVHLLLVGDGPARAEIEARAAALRIAERVVITGRVPHDDVPHYIAAMDVAVVADERTGVASPMKLLEYMAMERAVIAPDLPNIRDVVRPAIDGLLFAQGDSDALAAILQKLRDAPALRQGLGARARQQVVDQRNWHANAKAALAAVMGR